MIAVALDSSYPAVAKRLPGRPVPAWSAEVCELPARLLLELPAPPSLALHVPGFAGIVRVGGEVAEGELGLDPEEWRALVVGVEADRVWPRDLLALCERKAAEPSYRIEAADTLCGAQPDPRETWDVGAVLDRMGAHLLGVELPATAPSAAA